MANHAKNIFVGTGGKEAIDKSHYLGAVCGLESIMGHTDTPVRALFDEALAQVQGHLPPIIWILTVMANVSEWLLTTGWLFCWHGSKVFRKSCSPLARGEYC